MPRNPAVTGRTLVIPLIGHPIEQVKTPGPLNRWFGERGIDAVVVPMDVRPERDQKPYGGGPDRREEGRDVLALSRNPCCQTK